MSDLVPIDEVVHFDVITSGSTGAAVDADSTPTFSVYEEDTDTAILGPTNFTKRTSLTGNYRGSITCSAANGFEAGKWYSVIASATVSSVAGKAVAKSFRVGPAESSAGVPKVDASHLAGTAYGSADFSATMKASINTEADTALADYDAPTKAELDAAESNIRGADSDTLKSLSDQIDGLSTAAAPQLLVNTTIATLASQTSFTLTAGSADDDAYAGAIAIITDQSTATQKAVASVSAYVGSTKTITLSADPGIFTMAVGDTIDLLAAIGSAPSAAAIRAEIDSNSTQLAAIVADTNELQTDWANGGRLDLILDARASQTSVDDLPTNAELATALASADDAVLSAIGSLSIPTAGAVADAVWDEAKSGHVSAGSFGLALGDTDLRGSRTVIRGTAASGATTTSLTPSALSPAGTDADQFKGRILIFDNDTTTAALRGQATDITASSAASLAVLTFTALTTAPASGDTFSIV